MPRLEGDIRGYPIPQYHKKNWQIPKYRVENRRNTDTAFMIGHAVSITRVFLFVCLFATVVTSTPAIFFNFQVKRDGHESNRATNLRLKHRLKERYSPLLPPPPPKWKNIARWGNAIFLQTRKNNTPPFQIFTYIRHERPNERYRNTVKDGFFYQIPLPRRMKNRIPRAGLDDTAIPHTKIKITEIPLEKKAQYRNTVNPHVPLTCWQCQGCFFS